jgi:hypothetical protein
MPACRHDHACVCQAKITRSGVYARFAVRYQANRLPIDDHLDMTVID